jgi:hypothetical protein
VQKILFNGCSQTEVGNLDYLENWQDYTWPHLLAKSLNCTYKNLAITLSDNSRIFSTTLNEILLDPPDIVIIGWTAANRKQLPLANGDIARLGPESCITDNATITEELNKHWYSVHQNEWLSYIETLEYMVAIKSICMDYNCKAYYFNAIRSNNLDNLIEHSFNVKVKHLSPRRVRPDIDKAKRLVDSLNDVSWLLDQDDSLLQYCHKNKLEMDKWGHPAENSQQHIADYFKEQIHV